jgi:hypothetical protein
MVERDFFIEIVADANPCSKSDDTIDHGAS